MTYENIKSLIKEEHQGYFKSRWKEGKDFEVYKNPTPEEFRGFIREGIRTGDFQNFREFHIRFIIDKSNNDLYIWKSSHALHKDMADDLSLSARQDRLINGVINSGNDKREILFDKNSNDVTYPQIIVSETKKYLEPLLNLNEFRIYINGEYYSIEEHHAI